MGGKYALAGSSPRDEAEMGMAEQRGLLNENYMVPQGRPKGKGVKDLGKHKQAGVDGSRSGARAQTEARQERRRSRAS